MSAPRTPAMAALHLAVAWMSLHFRAACDGHFKGRSEFMASCARQTRHAFLLHDALAGKTTVLALPAQEVQRS